MIMSSSDTEDIHSKNIVRIRKTREQLLSELRAIRKMMLDGYTNPEIIAALNISERNFYRYMDKIYQEDRIHISKLKEETIVTHMILLHERLLQSVRNCHNIAADPNVPAKDRIEAERLKIEINTKIFRLLCEGSVVLQVKQRNVQNNNSKVFNANSEPNSNRLF